MPRTALLIGPAADLARLEQQLDLVPDRPITIGWILPDGTTASPDAPVVGDIAGLEAALARRTPDVALVSMPAVFGQLVTSVRTRLRRAGIADRFLPTLDDQLAGIGPRTHLEVDLAALLDRPPRDVDTRSISGVVDERCVLITGAGGSIGSELARIVARHRPSRLLLMERAENALFEIDRQVARLAPDLDRLPILHDVVDADGTLDRFQVHRPDVIIHAAAHKHVPMMELHPGAAVDNNVFGTLAVAEAADAIDAERFVMISTDKAINPASMMGATKRLAELCVQEIGQSTSTACAVVRFGNVLGSSGSVIDVWSREIAAGGPLSVTDPRMRRYFMTIQEAAALVLEAAALVDGSVPGAEVFLLDMGESVRIVDMADRFVRQHGLQPLRTGADAPPAGTPGVPIVFTGARPGEKLEEDLAGAAESLQPTRHSSINIWHVPRPAPGFSADIRRRMSPAVRASSPDAVAELVREIVPEMVRPAA